MFEGCLKYIYTSKYIMYKATEEEEAEEKKRILFSSVFSTFRIYVITLMILAKKVSTKTLLEVGERKNGWYIPYRYKKKLIV